MVLASRVHQSNSCSKSNLHITKTKPIKNKKERRVKKEMAEQEYLSIADLELLEQMELEGFRPEADANASLPPIPAGNYQARVTYANESEPDKIWMPKQQDVDKGGKKYHAAMLRIETVGNGAEFDGRVMQFFASTLVFKGSGTTSIQQVLQPLGFGERLMTMTKTARTQIELLNEALEGGQALIGVKVDWEAQVYDKEADETTFGPVRGMKRFPLDANGQHCPVLFKDLKGNKSSEGVQARNVVRGFLSLDALSGIESVQSSEGDETEQDEPATEVPVIPQSKPVAQSKPVPQPTTTAKPAAPVAAPQATSRPAPRPVASGRTAVTRRG
jgi:hypothetical protein